MRWARPDSRMARSSFAGASARAQPVPQAGLQRVREQVVVAERLGQLDRAVAERARLVGRAREGERAAETRDRPHVVGVRRVAVDRRQRRREQLDRALPGSARAARRRPRRRWRPRTRCRGDPLVATRSASSRARAKSPPSRWLRDAASSRLSRSSASSVSVRRPLQRPRRRPRAPGSGRPPPPPGSGSAPPCPRTRACAHPRSGRPAAGRSGPTRGSRVSITCATRACSWARRDDAQQAEHGLPGQRVREPEGPVRSRRRLDQPGVHGRVQRLQAWCRASSPTPRRAWSSRTPRR